MLWRNGNSSRAFTIVELLIVVVVVAILATIVIVSYSGIQKQAIRSSVQAALSNASTAMKVEAVKSDAGFVAIPSNVNPPDKVGLALTELSPPGSTDTSFCMNGTYIGHNDIAYHITEEDEISEGLCDGDVIIGTVVGEYNFEAGGQVDLGYTPITEGVSSADLYGFKVSTNIEWTEVVLRWDAQPGATRYEVQTKTNSNPNWYYRSTSNGGGSCSGGVSPTCSNGLPDSTTSLNWTDVNYALPSAAGKTYDYRLRPCTGVNQDTCGDWTVAVLSNPVQNGEIIPEVKGFGVSPASDWSSVNISWNESPRYATDMSATRYEVQTKTNSNPNWYYRSTSNGGGSCSGGVSPACSNGLPRSTTSLSWTDAEYSLPVSAGKVYDYRIRNCITGQASYCGPWVEVSLSNPIQGTGSVPVVTGFTVAPAGGWSSVGLSWNKAPNYATDMSATRYEVQTKTNSNPNWYYRSTATGDGSCSGGVHPSCSNGLPASTTSLSWTSVDYSLPSAAGKNYDYRVRNCVSGHTTYCGEWSQVSLSNPIQSNSDIPDVAGFTVAPAGDWSSVNLSWNQAPEYSTDTASTRYEVQTRTDSDPNWRYRSTSNGGGSCSGGIHPSCSNGLPRSTTSLTWTDPSYSVPAVGKTISYQIRNCITGHTTYCSNWTVRSLSR